MYWKRENKGEISNLGSTTKNGRQKFWRLRIGKILSEKVKLGRFSRSPKNFRKQWESEMGGNAPLPQGGLTPLLVHVATPLPVLKSKSFWRLLFFKGKGIFKEGFHVLNPTQRDPSGFPQSPRSEIPVLSSRDLEGALYKFWLIEIVGYTVLISQLTHLSVWLFPQVKVDTENW